MKNPTKTDRGIIHYHDIGDYLTREEKLARLAAFASGEQVVPWRRIEPDSFGDWINQRDPRFDSFLALGDKKNPMTQAVFRSYSLGLATNRDAWCYNGSRQQLERNVRRSLTFYNNEVERFLESDGSVAAQDFTKKDPTQFSWDATLLHRFGKSGHLEFDRLSVRPSMYRPFSRQWAYFDRSYNSRVGKLPSFFPGAGHENRVICVTGIGARRVSFLMADLLPDLHLIDPAQCFPRYEYSETHDGQIERHSNITEGAIRAFRDVYPDHADDIDADTIFDYIYGLLHSREYLHRFGKNLVKQLPRIPLVADAEDFVAFTEAGASLGDLHVNYEQVDLYPAPVNGKPFNRRAFSDEDLRVEKMRFGGKRGSDRSTIQYNHRITVSGIPEEAYDYSVNGRSPVEWVVDRQRVSTHKASGIVNDANRYAVETVGDAAYPLKLLLRAITVGVETARIVAGLPALRIIERSMGKAGSPP